MPAPREDRLLRHARREALFTAALCLLAAAYTVTFCARYGLRVDGPWVDLVWGVPAWVAYGIVAPWLVCTVITAVFAWRLMRDDPIANPGEADEDDALLDGGDDGP